MVSFGIGPCYVLVGTLLGGLAGLNHLFLQPAQSYEQLMKSKQRQVHVVGEKEESLSSSSSLSSSPSFRTTMESWSRLYKQPRIRDAVTANLAYWIG